MNQKQVEQISQKIGGRNVLIVHEKEYLFFSATVNREDLKAMLKSILLDLTLEDEANAKANLP